MLTTPPLRALRSLLTGIALLLLLPLGLEAQEKRPLDHGDHELWNAIQQQRLSPDGQWLTWRLNPRDGEAVLHLVNLGDDSVREFPRGTGARFTRDSRFLVFQVQPTEEAREEARGNRNTPAPNDSLAVLEIATGEMRMIPDVDDFTVPSESAAWILVHRDAPAEEDPDEEEPAEEVEEERTEAQQRIDRRRSNKPVGTDLHYMNLQTGEERIFRRVLNYTAHEDGDRFVYVTSSRNGTADGVHYVRADSEEVRTILMGEGRYTDLTIDQDWTQVAFLTTRDSWTEEDLDPALYHGTFAGSNPARLLAVTGTEGIPEGWSVSTNGNVNFSYDGSRLFFPTAPPPEPEPEEKDELLENVVVDIWNWRDDFLQSHQLASLNSERRRTYEAVVHLGEDRIVQLEDTSLLSVSVGDRRSANIALGHDELPYRQIVSWDTRFVDTYIVDPRTGEREFILEKMRTTPSLSPEARWIVWWDGGEFQGDAPRGWFVMDPETREVVNATEAIPHPVYNELTDRTAPPGSYGTAGWTEGDEYLIVYDAFDLWKVDPRGVEAPVNLTDGYGRDHDIRLRVVRLDWDDRYVPLDEEIMLSAFQNSTKADGYYRTRLDGPRAPERVVLEDVNFGSLQKAEDADRLIFTKTTFQDFGDIWTSDTDFNGQRRLTHANPQQEEFLWGTAELATWTSADGEELQGILYKPENFDPNEKWPMMVYFYERSSNGLHNYFTPGTGTSINRTFYVSRGYVLFVPDIPYKPGYPGESAMNAVIPGITHLVNQGWVDQDRIGVQGHSWGGYQIAYMVTRTNIFAAAEAGAPVTNMTSAYGGIRWESGRVRQMQYETGQSRIGASLWEAQHRYIENSPLFTAYKVETPLLILHNDEDGAVPWEEGIQFFVALRRLGKPAWLVNYNGGGHGVSGQHRQMDWSIRMQQFFDHYLKDAPPPVWMVEGVPAIRKGLTLGLDLVEDWPTADDRNDRQNDRQNDRER